MPEETTDSKIGSILGSALGIASKYDYDYESRATPQERDKDVQIGASYFAQILGMGILPERLRAISNTQFISPEGQKVLEAMIREGITKASTPK